MTQRFRQSALTVVLVLVASLVSYYAGAAQLLPSLNQALTRGKATEGLDAKRLQTVQDYIHSKFVKPVETEQLMQGALRGMVEATGDKYSAYFSPTEYARFWERFEASFSGIGVHVELSTKTGLVTVVAPIKGSPGEKAGLRKGDAIVAVDDKELSPPITLEEAVTMIKGPKGTSVRLKISREGSTQPMVFQIERATIEIPSIEAKMLDKEAGVGYLQIREFNKDLTARVSKALNDMKQQGMTRLVLDLRQNPGGLLSEAIGVSSLFVPNGKPVVHILERGQEKVTRTAKANQHFELPMVVLVDGGSASAAEILSGAIKDHKLGVLVGQKTFGKGTVQSFFEMADKSGIKLTTAEYLTAGEIHIHEKGIEPDVAVENPKNMLPGDPGDQQLQEGLNRVKAMKR